MKFEHLQHLNVSALFSKNGKFRYQLSISKKDTKNDKTLCVIMKNPSIANELVADKSVQFLEKLIFEKNYPEFKDVNKIIVVNQFAFIQTNNFEGNDNEIGSENDYYVLKAINESQIILIAWGRSNTHIERKETILKFIRTQKNKKIYQTKKHPSRGFYSDFIEKYVI